MTAITDELFVSPHTGLTTPKNFADPKHEAYMLKRVTDIDLAVAACKKKAVAVQAGGYVGMWPLRLAKTFSLIHTFEPLPLNFAALRENTKNVPGIVCHHGLLSDVDGATVKFAVRKGWGSRITENDPNSEHYEDRVTTTIDALNLPCCDAIFLDIEGHELQALSGASKTIAQFRPVITLEVWDDRAKEYDSFMTSLGYERVARSHMDSIYKFPGK